VESRLADGNQSLAAAATIDSIVGWHYDVVTNREWVRVAEE